MTQLLLVADCLWFKSLLPFSMIFSGEFPLPSAAGMGRFYYQCILMDWIFNVFSVHGSLIQRCLHCCSGLIGEGKNWQDGVCVCVESGDESVVFMHVVLVQGGGWSWPRVLTAHW